MLMPATREPASPEEASPYDQVNIEIPKEFPTTGMTARAASTLVDSETWTDANPELNLSSFVTTYCEPELRGIYDRHAHKNFADPDMYPHTKATEAKIVRWLHDLWHGPAKVEPTRMMRTTLENSIHLRDRLVGGGRFDVLNTTQRIPVVALALKPDVKRYNEFDISNKVRERGWVLSAYTMPPDAQDVRTLRIVVRPHLNLDSVEILATDIERAIAYLEQHGGNATPPKLHEAGQSSLKC
jgi:glutamate/tyrosine decarboxylase-like PLP-dependent enzyme